MSLLYLDGVVPLGWRTRGSLIGLCLARALPHLGEDTKLTVGGLFGSV
jgi:hypothetical protein